jgi:putative flippase GtrA
MIAELMRFGVVGVGAMATHWCVVALLVPLGLKPLFANVIGFCVAFNVSFFGHHHWTFTSSDSQKNTFKRFLGVAVLGFIINESMYSALLKLTSLDYRVALAIVLIAVAGLTFALSRFWAFRQQ